VRLSWADDDTAVYHFDIGQSLDDVLGVCQQATTAFVGADTWKERTSAPVSCKGFGEVTDIVGQDKLSAGGRYAIVHTWNPWVTIRMHVKPEDRKTRNVPVFAPAVWGRNSPNINAFDVHKSISDAADRLQQAVAPERKYCGDVWGSRCHHLVTAPSWSHGEHGTSYKVARRKRTAKSSTASVEALSVLAVDEDEGVAEAAKENPRFTGTAGDGEAKALVQLRNWWAEAIGTRPLMTAPEWGEAIGGKLSMRQPGRIEAVETESLLDTPERQEQAGVKKPPDTGSSSLFLTERISAHAAGIASGTFGIDRKTGKGRVSTKVNFRYSPAITFLTGMGLCSITAHGGKMPGEDVGGNGTVRWVLWNQALPLIAVSHLVWHTTLDGKAEEIETLCGGRSNSLRAARLHAAEGAEAIAPTTARIKKKSSR